MKLSGKQQFDSKLALINQLQLQINYSVSHRAKRAQTQTLVRKVHNRILQLREQMTHNQELGSKALVSMRSQQQQLLREKEDLLNSFELLKLRLEQMRTKVRSWQSFQQSAFVRVNNEMKQRMVRERSLNQQKVVFSQALNFYWEQCKKMSQFALKIQSNLNSTNKFNQQLQLALNLHKEKYQELKSQVDSINSACQEKAQQLKLVHQDGVQREMSLRELSKKQEQSIQKLNKILKANKSQIRQIQLESHSLTLKNADLVSRLNKLCQQAEKTGFYLQYLKQQEECQSLQRSNLQIRNQGLKIQLSKVKQHRERIDSVNRQLISSIFNQKQLWRLIKQIKSKNK